jgi:hypothetical protein
MITPVSKAHPRCTNLDCFTAETPKLAAFSAKVNFRRHKAMVDVMIFLSAEVAHEKTHKDTDNFLSR